MVGCLPHKCKALSSNSSTAKKKSVVEQFPFKKINIQKGEVEKGNKHAKRGYL
jgi:hypothetical protein